MSEQRTVVVPGKPMTWSRARTSTKSGKVIFFTPEDREQRMGEIKLFWRAKGFPRVEKPLPVGLRCEFLFDRPAGHFGTGRNASVLKESCRHLRPLSGTNGGDLDNLVKLVKDSLNEVAYVDDSQIAELQATKRYCEPGETPETRITLVPLTLGFELPEIGEHEPAQMALT